MDAVDDELVAPFQSPEPSPTAHQETLCVQAFSPPSSPGALGPEMLPKYYASCILAAAAADSEQVPASAADAEAAAAMEAAWTRAKAAQQQIHAQIHAHMLSSSEPVPPAEVAPHDSHSRPHGEHRNEGQQDQPLPADLHFRLSPPLDPSSPPPPSPFLHGAHPWANGLSLLRHALLRPPWHPGTICGVLRRVRTPGHDLIFEFHLQLPGHDLLILAAKKLVRALTSYYAIALDPREVHRDSEHYMGKLRATSVGGAEWVLFDNGLPERHVHRDAASTERARLVRRQLLAVSFERQAAPGSGPTRITAVVPHHSDSGCGCRECSSVGVHDCHRGSTVSAGSAPSARGAGVFEAEGKLLRRWRQQQNSAEEGDGGRTGGGAGKEGGAECSTSKASAAAGGVLSLQSVLPRWDERLQAYTLEYEGRRAHGSLRATFPSVKNVQLVAASPASSTGHEDATPLYFSMGKLGDDLFSVDFRAPITPMAAFGLALAVCDVKLALTRRLDGVLSVAQRKPRVVPFPPTLEARPPDLS